MFGVCVFGMLRFVPWVTIYTGRRGNVNKQDTSSTSHPSNLPPPQKKNKTKQKQKQKTKQNTKTNKQTKKHKQKSPKTKTLTKNHREREREGWRWGWGRPSRNAPLGMALRNEKQTVSLTNQNAHDVPSYSHHVSADACFIDASKARKLGSWREPLLWGLPDNRPVCFDDLGVDSTLSGQFVRLHAQTSQKYDLFVSESTFLSWWFSSPV